MAALRHRDRTGRGQYIDLGLFDSQIAWLINGGLNYLPSGVVPGRLGNAHPNIVPYQVFPTGDGHIILAVGNDAQYRRFCEFAEAAELADDPRFATNAQRVRNRDALVPPPAPEPCQLVFMDPPYNENLALPALTALQTAGWLAEGALVSLEVMKSEAVTLPDGFQILDDRTYGKARLIILSR